MALSTHNFAKNGFLAISETFIGFNCDILTFYICRNLKKFLELSTHKNTKNTNIINMVNIKKLASGILFKIFIGFLILSFAFFGVSSFLLSGADSWVAKVGSKKISQNKLQKVMKIEGESLLRANANNQKAVDYVNSSQFAVDSLSKIINQTLVEKLSSKYGVSGDRQLILQAVAKDPSFQKNGKFDHQYFKFFLAQNGLDEEAYVSFIKDEIVNAMVVNSISMTSPIDGDIAAKIAILREEKRVADLIVITKNSFVKTPQPKDSELQTLYEANKANFTLPERRKISYIAFKKSDVAKNLEVGDSEAKSYYETNKANYKQEEKRDFYHIVLQDEKQAGEFAKSVKKSADKVSTFLALAKNYGKNEKSATLLNMSKKDVLPQLSQSAFSLKKNESSDAIKSDLGFHIFLLKDVKNNNYVDFAQVKNSIKSQILTKKENDFVEKKISEIENFLLSSNSLEKTAQKFGFSNITNLPEIDQQGLDVNNKAVSQTEQLENFVQNSFIAKEKQVSSIFPSSNLFYALKVEKISPARQKTFTEVKDSLAKIYAQEKEKQSMKEFAQKISDLVKKDPQNARQIANNFGLRFEANKEFARTILIEYQGQKIPYSDNFLQELFDLKIGQATSYHASKDQEFKIAILKNVKETGANQVQINAYKKELANVYRNEFVDEFNKYMQENYKIEVNKKFIASLEKKQ